MIGGVDIETANGSREYMDENDDRFVITDYLYPLLFFLGVRFLISTTIS